METADKSCIRGRISTARRGPSRHSSGLGILSFLLKNRLRTHRRPSGPVDARNETALDARVHAYSQTPAKTPSHRTLACESVTSDHRDHREKRILKKEEHGRDTSSTRHDSCRTLLYVESAERDDTRCL